MPIVRVKCAFNMFADVSKTCDNEVDCGGGVFFSRALSCKRLKNEQRSPDFDKRQWIIIDFNGCVHK